MKISFSKAASTLSLAALAMTAATSAQAAVTNLDLNIKRVILVQDPSAFDNNPDSNEHIAFDAATAGGNQVVNLLSTSARNGITIPLTAIPDAGNAGVFRSIIIELDNTGGLGFSSLTDADSTPRSLIPALGPNVGLDNPNDHAYLLIGQDHPNLDTALAPTQAMAPVATVAPFELNEGSITIPSLDIQIPAASVIDAGAGNDPQFSQAPVISSVRPASLQNVDSDTMKNLEVTITGAELTDALDLSSPADDNSTETIKLGLFNPTTGIAHKAIYTDTQTYVANASAVITDDVVFTFTDVAAGDDATAAHVSSLIPVLFRDTNNNDIVDADEEFIATDNTNFGDLSATFDATGTAAETIEATFDPAASATSISTKVQTVTFGIDKASDGAQAIGSDIEFTVQGGTTPETAAAVSGTITLEIGSTANVLTTAFGVNWEKTGENAGAGGDIDPGDVLHPGLLSADVTALENVSFLTYDNAGDTISVDLPYTAITGASGNSPVGSFVPVAFTSATTLTGHPATNTDSLSTSAAAAGFFAPLEQAD